MKRHALSILDFSADEVMEILSLAQRLKAELKMNGANSPTCIGKCMVMIFEKPSLRTRLSFEVGMRQLGGFTVCLTNRDIGVDSREPVSDIGKVVSRMGDLIMARTFAHETLTRLAEASQVPVINGLSDLEHPCQILADLLTVIEMKGALKNLKIAYVGDGENNVTHSLALASGLLGVHFTAASPQGYWMNEEVMLRAQSLAAAHGGEVRQTEDPVAAVLGADVVYTDTWVSMGDEEEKGRRLSVFPPYRVTRELMRHADPDALFMHDLPAYRGNEVEAEVIDGPQSVVWQEAENRLHAQKGLVSYLLNNY